MHLFPHNILKMKKTILKFTLAATLCAAPVAMASAQEAETSAKVVSVIEQGDSTLITVDGTEYMIATEDFKAEIERGLTPVKIANNERISQADSTGVGVTVMAMCIVLGALIVLSVLFMIFGKLFTRSHAQRKREASGAAPEAENHEDELAHGEVIAAIAAALDEHFNSKHDLEDTVLTIRRMQRAYSPWNSKIYNMREVPTLRKNNTRK